MEIDAAVKILLSLKADFKNVTGKDWKPGVMPSPAGQTASNKGIGDKCCKSEGVENTGKADELNDKIQTQGNKVRELKSKKADKVRKSTS